MRTRLTLFNVFFLLFLGQMVVAQVTGTINDGDNFPVYDAEVLVKGTDKKAFTNEEGKFSIDAKVGDVLVVTGPDMTVGEYAVTKPNLGALTLGAIVKLDEAVVIGYGITETNEQKTGAYNTMGAKEITAVSSVSFDQALQGQAPGVVVSTGSGQPGGSTPIIIRGLTSLSGSSYPLVVINGVPVQTKAYGLSSSSNPLANIDPSTIENVTVLKDAQATSLYGARGANGVILVTLKKGAKNQSKFTFSSELGFGKAAFEKGGWLNAQEHIDYTATAIQNSSIKSATIAKPALSWGEAYNAAVSRFRWDGVTDTDWSKATRNSQTSSEKYTISYQGGSDNMRTFASLGYFNQTGLARKSFYERMTGYLNTEWDANEKLTVGFDISLALSKQSGPTETQAYNNPIFAGRALSPTQKIYNDDGTYNINLVYGSSNSLNNPVGTQDINVNDMRTYKVLTSVFTTYKISPYLTFDSRFGVDFNYQDDLKWWNPDFGDGLSFNGLGRKHDRNILTWTWTNSLNFNKTFADFHNVSATIATEALDSEHKLTYLEKTGYAAGQTLPGLENAVNYLGGGSYKVGSYSFMSYVTRLAYSYDQKYTISANYRRDGSSRFGSDNRWGNFWGAGVSHNWAKEEFLKGSIVDILKLRASYGEVGNAEIGDYASRYLYTVAEGPYLENPGGGITQAGNPGLHWETTRQVDVGLDFGFFKNRVSGSLDWYQKKAKNLLYEVAMPSSTSGLEKRWDNIGDVQSQGFEVMLNVIPFRTDDFIWTISGNYAYNDSKIKNVKDGGPTPTTYGNKAFADGHNPSEFYTKLWAGVNPKDGTPLWYTDGTRTKTTGVFAEVASAFSGKQALPIHTAGLNTSLEYKGIRLSAQFSYAGGHHVYDPLQQMYNSSGANQTFNTRKEWVEQAWTPENPNAKLPQIIDGGNNLAQAGSTRYLYRADNIKLRSIELGYKFGKKILGENSLVDGVYLYVKGYNLYTWVFDDDLYFDPESSMSMSGNTYTQLETLGYHNLSSPSLKQYLFGAIIEF